MNEDAALLRRYAEEGSEGAFTEVVHRHINLVYGAALRRTGGDPHCAADVAQQVFTTLAREARQLSRHAVLDAWLHTATRNAALNLMISEQRRKIRETAAHALAPAPDDPPLEWDRLRPELDSAIDQLSEADRAAVVLRFLDQRPYSEVGAALCSSEDAARMRTARALEKLREVLSRRGITSTAAALGALVSSQPLISAPAGLAATLASRSLATAGAAGLAAATLPFMSLKLLTTATLSALAAFGVGAYFGFSRDFDAPPPPPLETPRQIQLIANLRKENASLHLEVDRLDARVAALRAAPSPAPKPTSLATPPVTSEVILARRTQQQKMMNNLRQLAACVDQYYLEHGHGPLSLNELVGEKNYMKRLIQIDGEDYYGISLLKDAALTVTTAGGVTVTYDPKGTATTKFESTPEENRADEIGRRLEPAGKRALDAYRAANGDKALPNAEALIPYFATPQEGADYVEFLEAQRAAGRKI